MQPRRPKVFISYARKDDDGFVRRLHDALTSRDIDVWWDRAAMESRGRTFLTEIRDAIEKADRLILVASPKAIVSEYVNAEILHAIAAYRAITPVVRVAPEGIDTVLSPLLRRHHAIDFRGARPFEEAADELAKLVTSPAEPGRLFGVPLMPTFYQTREELNAIKAQLLVEARDTETRPPGKRTFFIAGMGGVGKSTLAAACAHSYEIRFAFYDGVLWLTVGRDRALHHLVADVGRTLGEPAIDYIEERDTQRELERLLSARDMLIILDDLWSGDIASAFQRALAPQACLLVTTRDGQLQTSLGASGLQLSTLEEKAARNFLAGWVSVQPDDLSVDAQKVLRYCEGLPFAIALCGAMVADGVSWKAVLEALDESDLGYLSMRFPDYVHPNLLRCLHVSLEALDRHHPEVGLLWRDLAAFDRPGGVPLQVAFRFWGRRSIKLRYLERVLSILERRALVRTRHRGDDDWLELHELHRLFLKGILGDQISSLHEAFLGCYKPDGGWVELPDDGYILDALVHHLEAANRSADVHGLVSSRWMAKRVAASSSHAPFADDVEASLRIATTCEPPDLVNAFRSALVRASIASFADDLGVGMFEVMTRAGNPAQALAYARCISTSDKRASALVSIGDILRDIGKEGLAGETYTEAEWLLSGINQVSEEAQALTQRIAKGRQQLTGVYEPAPASVVENDAFSQYQTKWGGSNHGDGRDLIHRAWLLYRDGRKDEARTIAREVASRESLSLDATYGPDALGPALDLMRELKDAEGLIQAADMVRSIDDNTFQEQAVSLLMEPMVDVGEYGVARSTVDSIGFPPYRRSALAKLMLVLSRAGRHAEAVTVLNEWQAERYWLTDYGRQADALFAIARALFGVHARDQALSVAGQAVQICRAMFPENIGTYTMADGEKALALGEAALLMWSLGDRPEGRKIAEEAVNETRFDNAFGEVRRVFEMLAAPMARAGFGDDIVDWAGLSGLGWFYQVVAQKVSDAWLEMGRRDDAIRLLFDASQLSWNGNLVGMLRKVDQADLALRHAKRDTSSFISALAVKDVANWCFEHGEPKKARALLEDARKIVLQTNDSPYNRCLPLIRIAEVWGRFGSRTKAVKILAEAANLGAEIREPRFRSQAYGLLAEAWHALGDMARVTAMVQRSMDVLSTEEDPLERTYALDSLGKTLATTERWSLFTRAVDLATQISDEGQKARALRAVTMRMQSRETIESVKMAIALADSFTDPKSSAIVMGKLCEVLWTLEGGEEPLRLWARSLKTGARAEYGAVMHMLGASAQMLAEARGADQLYGLYEVFLEICDWWTVG